LVRLDNADCLAVYSDSFGPNYQNLLVVSNQIQSNGSLYTIYTHQLGNALSDLG
jgi:hypothetical protein